MSASALHRQLSRSCTHVSRKNQIHLNIPVGRHRLDLPRAARTAPPATNSHTTSAPRTRRPTRFTPLRCLGDLDPIAEATAAALEPTTVDADAAADADASAAASLRAAALQEYRTIVTGTEDDLPLLRCAVLIAKHRYPSLDESRVASTIANLAQQVREQLAGNTYPMKVIRTINEVLYAQHGYRGNELDYYDPDNSCINRVLEKRTGLPISMSLVYMEVARAVGLPMVGMNLPCHFMIRPSVEGVEVLVDAFNGGEVCYLEDAEQLLSKLMGANVVIDPKFLEPGRHISDRLFLLRMLTNLKQVYLLTQQFELGLRVVRYLRATDPTNLDYLKEEGSCLFYLNQHQDAEVVLKLYLQLAPKAYDSLKVETMLEFIASTATTEEEAAAGVSSSGSSTSASKGEPARGSGSSSGGEGAGVSSSISTGGALSSSRFGPEDAAASSSSSSGSGGGGSIGPTASGNKDASSSGSSGGGSSSSSADGDGSSSAGVRSAAEGPGGEAG